MFSDLEISLQLEYFRECMPFFTFPIPPHMVLVVSLVTTAACSLGVGGALLYRARHCGTQPTLFSSVTHPHYEQET